VTTLTLTAPRTDPTGGVPTLDELIVDAWEGLAARRAVRCVVCGERMEPEYGAHARPLGGQCEACGSTLH
jgi:hypothetical protein